MTIEEVVYWYAGIFCVLLAALVWLLLKRKAEKTRNAAAAVSGSASEQHPGKSIDWSAVLALRPHKMLTGDMWLKALIAAFVALCAGVIVVVFIFPLGAGWAAAGSFVTVALLVVLFLFLME